MTIERVGWSGLVVRLLLRALLLAGAATVAYMAISLFGSPAQADSGPAASMGEVAGTAMAPPGPARVVDSLLGGVTNAVSALTGAASTPDATGQSGEPAAGRSDESDRAAPRQTAEPRGAIKESGASAAADAGRAGAGERSAPAAAHTTAGDPAARTPSALVGAAAPALVERPVSAVVGAATSGDAILPGAGQVLDVVGVVDTVRALAPAGTVNAITRAVLDAPLLPLVARSLPPRLADPLWTLNGTLVEPVVGVVSTLPARILAPAAGSHDEHAVSTLLAPPSGLGSRFPPSALAPGLLPDDALARAGTSTWGFTDFFPGISRFIPGVPRPEIRPDAPGGSGGVPVRQPGAPESAANGHLRAGGEGSPDRPAADRRLAWHPELAAGAVVAFAHIQRVGRSAEADAPSG